MADNCHPTMQYLEQTKTNDGNAISADEVARKYQFCELLSLCGNTVLRGNMERA